MKVISYMMVAIVVVMFQGCFAYSSQESAGDYVNSSIITANVKARLAGTAGLESLTLNVDTINGTTLLSGFAQNSEQKVLAGEVAETTKGVRKVINTIVVQ
ncbi:MAG TPA: BON domain-containing protein [Epsilonproteobacteria bacterium]|nr:BON domain-containing protein [Campylobacterota bacterium]HHH37851.1 BON domain-containing protein [Campylobacterota bacterium]